MERLFPISGKIISASIVRGQGFGGDYVEYKIKIATYYKIWYIKKRYSDFERLNKILSRTYPDLPMFPPKRIFKNSDETIEERRKMFNKYLKFILTKINIFANQDILDFIKIDKKVLELFIKKHSMMLVDNEKDKNLSSNSSFNKLNMFYKSKYEMEKPSKKPKSVENDSNKINKPINIEDYNNESEEEKQNYYASFLDYKLRVGEIEKKNLEEVKNASMLVIEEFLINLSQKKENKSEIIKTFEGFLKRKKKWPCFNQDEISKLFEGEKTTSSEVSINNQSNTSTTSNEEIKKQEKIIKGLLFHIGDIENNILGAQSCLEFLVKLLDYEYNPQCELYRHVFRTRKIESLLEMKLIVHAKSTNIKIVNSVYQILKILIDEKMNKKKLKVLINDDEVLENFMNWVNIN